MASEMEAALRRHFMDPEFWRPRLAQLERTPRQLVLYPRPDDSRPGTEVIELRLCAHDGERLTALLVRSSFGQRCETLRLRSTSPLTVAALDWSQVEEGITDVVFDFPPTHRLEDRVLDVLRILNAARSVKNVDGARVEMGPCGAGAERDAVCIAKMIHAKGWG